MNRPYMHLFISILAISACTPSVDGGQPTAAPDPVFSSLHHGKRISLTAGKMFEVALEASAGTGFQWHLDVYDKDIIELVDRRTDQKSGHAPGYVGGTYRDVWVLKTLKKGRTQLRFDLFPPWEGRSATKNTVSLMIVVIQ